MAKPDISKGELVKVKGKNLLYVTAPEAYHPPLDAKGATITDVINAYKQLVGLEGLNANEMMAFQPDGLSARLSITVPKDSGLVTRLEKALGCFSASIHKGKRPYALSGENALISNHPIDTLEITISDNDRDALVQRLAEFVNDEAARAHKSKVSHAVHDGKMTIKPLRLQMQSGNLSTAIQDVSAGLKIVLGQEDWQKNVLTFEPASNGRAKVTLRLPWDDAQQTEIKHALRQFSVGELQEGRVHVNNTAATWMEREQSDFPTLSFEVEETNQKPLLEALANFVNARASIQGSKVQEQISAIQNSSIHL